MSDLAGGGAGETRRRLLVFAQAARALHGEPDLDSLLQWATSAAANLTGLHAVGFCYTPQDGSPWWTEHDPRSSRFGELGDPRTIKPLAGAVGGEGVAHLDDLDVAMPQRPPALADTRSLAVVPAIGTTGSAFGAMFLASPEPGAITDDTLTAVEALCAHLGVALDNHAALAHLADLEARGKEVVHQLQQAVRPPAPVIRQTELGMHYVAADPSAPTGGDLYDWLLLPNGDLHLAIVDVMGKGVEATKHALIITHALRLLAVQDCPLEEIVTRADALVTAQHPDLVATVLLARYDPDSGRIHLAGAGHPPALLVSNGTAEEISAPGIPIGWPGAGSHGVVDLDLGRGDPVIFYTDGLIEATKDILAGLEALSHFAVETASYPARALARVLVERALTGADRHDDSLAIVLRRRSPVQTSRQRPLAPLVHRFSPTPAAVTIARHLLHDWLTMVPAEPEGSENVLLVASELCSNAVRHASGEPGGITLTAWVDGDDVVVEVKDDGKGLAPATVVSDEPPDPEAEEGRGLFLVRTIADELSFDVHDDGTSVRAVHWSVVGIPEKESVFRMEDAISAPTGTGR
jgi:serine phosphatase RsbU (regulator of sigma subunit)/anti-sigma regulatory factor (Ser/Thr protein kinase)